MKKFSLEEVLKEDWTTLSKNRQGGIKRAVKRLIEKTSVSPQEMTYKTDDLTKSLGVSRMTLYQWEKDGIFTPPRNVRGDRVFTKDQLNSIVKAFKPGGKRSWHYRPRTSIIESSRPAGEPLETQVS